MTGPLRDPEDLRTVLGVPYTEEQLAAITAPLEPAVIVAGAGSGKTTVMAARVVWLVGTGQVPAAAVLGLTFTNKAAGELAGRVRAALDRAGVRSVEEGEDPGEPTVATYHAFAGTLLADHGLRLGVEPRARLLADASRYQLAARVIRNAPGPYPTLTKSTADLVVDVLALAGEVAEHLVDLDHLRAHDRQLLASLANAKGADSPTSAIGKAIAAAERRLDLVELVERYQRAKTDAGLVDFGDQMALAARLAETCPEVGELERARYRVVLLDEYQDTSVAQRRMLVGLFGGGHPVTAVGDPCQAIYGWRGASVANLEDFPAHFRRTDGPARRYSLRENRRNGELILDLANSLAEPLREIHDGVAPLLASANNVGHGEIHTGLLPDYPSEIEWVGEQVTAALRSGTPAGEIAVLVRATRDIGPLHGELVGRDIPVEVVGLGGLVHLPEVADVIAVLEVLDDPCANAALIRLLTGPRWRIGARDLALLGRRARQLVAAPRHNGPALEAAPGVTDPAELVSLVDALAAPGDGRYSEAARERFTALDRELRELRRHLGEPLLDLVHRVLAVTGLGVEIAAAPHAVAARRRESLSAFADLAAGFTDLDGDSSVAAFLAWLRAAEEHERGLDTATPTGAESVKLMTAHKAKGLEWDVVVLPDVTASVFPSNRGRPKWTTRGECLPYPLRGDRDALPEVTEWTAAGLNSFDAGVREQGRLEELRLAYVATTRPRRRLVMSAHWWGPTQKKVRGPSDYLIAARQFADERGLDPVGPWTPRPPAEEENPLRGLIVEYPWPAQLDPVAVAARREGAAMVRAALSKPALDAPPPPAGLNSADSVRVAAWDRDLGLLLTELRADADRVRTVRLPAGLSASQVLVLASDPDGLARDLARPMPRPPAPAARRGTRFHAWVEAQFGQQSLLDVDDLPEAADADLDDEELAALQQAFKRGPYAARRPYQVEAPFALALAGRVIRGRIDAVYEHLGGWEVVDWKTHRSQSADPLQLAIYRLAWAEIVDADPATVDAVFCYVRSGKIVRPELPDRAELERLLAGG